MVTTRVKQHQWHCWLDTDGEDNAVVVKASNAMVAVNKYAALRNVNSNSVNVKLFKRG